MISSTSQINQSHLVEWNTNHCEYSALQTQLRNSLYNPSVSCTEYGALIQTVFSHPGFAFTKMDEVGQTIEDIMQEALQTHAANSLVVQKAEVTLDVCNQIRSRTCRGHNHDRNH